MFFADLGGRSEQAPVADAIAGVAELCGPLGRDPDQRDSTVVRVGAALCEAALLEPVDDVSDSAGGDPQNLTQRAHRARLEVESAEHLVARERQALCSQLRVGGLADAVRRVQDRVDRGAAGIRTKRHVDILSVLIMWSLF